MNLVDKNIRIGIWGFGITGKSAAQHFITHGYALTIMDQRQPTPTEQEYLNKKNITWYTQETESDLFFNSCDFIIPSPGINIIQSGYATHAHKCITELDVFSRYFHKPIIAITGSVGKTSTTTILAQVFAELSIPVAIGGNIGTPTFDLIAQQNTVDYALLEVSSFQLMNCNTFAPHIAIWTNFYPNHLDYHATEDEYLTAKYAVLKNQPDNPLSLIPFSLRDKIPAANHQQSRAYFSTEPIAHKLLTAFNHNEIFYYIENNCIMRYADNTHTSIINLTDELTAFSFIENILIAASVCDIMHRDPHVLHSITQTNCLPEHRTEKIGIINNVTFYNDSKATTTASTLAAVQKLKNKPLHLFLGGLSKGVDRMPFITQLKNDVHYIYCFGKEAQELYIMCKNNNIPAMHFTTLNEAFDKCINQIQPNDCVLLSPAGSSYDLYENYEHRGNHFKELVTTYLQRLTV